MVLYAAALLHLQVQTCPNLFLPLLFNFLCINFPYPYPHMLCSPLTMFCCILFISLTIPDSPAWPFFVRYCNRNVILKDIAASLPVPSHVVARFPFSICAAPFSVFLLFLSSSFCTLRIDIALSSPPPPSHTWPSFPAFMSPSFVYPFTCRPFLSPYHFLSVSFCSLSFCHMLFISVLLCLMPVGLWLWMVRAVVCQSGTSSLIAPAL